MKKNTIFKYCVSLAMGLALSSSLCASYDVTTVAGVAGSFAHTDGVGTAARFKSPGMMSINLSTGDLLVPGSDNNVRKVTTAGDVYAVSTLFNYNVGSPPVQAVCAYITSAGVPSIITTDNYSNLYQWIQSGGTYVHNTSLNAVSGPAYDGWGLVVDSSNNIFMTDGQSNQIYKILPNGSYSIFAGQGWSAGSADGTGAAARFNGITGITIDSSNNLYASDTGNKTIRKITSAGVVTTIAGTAGSSGSTDAAGSAARFNSPWDIDIDAAGNLYIADRGNNSIRKLTLSGATYTASTIAGTARGHLDGTGTAARFIGPGMLSIDNAGNLLVPDSDQNVRQVSTTDGVYTVSTLFQGTSTIEAVCQYITSTGTSTILSTDSFANLYQWVLSGGTYVSNTSLNAVTTPAFAGWGLVADSSKNIYMTDSTKNVIFKIQPSGTYSVFAGTYGTSGATDGTQTGAGSNSTSGSGSKFNGITGVTIDSSGNLYVSDTGNNLIRKITPAGVVTTIAGTTRRSVDGVGTSARFINPGMLSIDLSTGDLLVPGSDNNVRKVTTTGGVYTVSTLFQGSASYTMEAVCQYITTTGTSTILSTDSYAHLYQWILSGGTYVSNTSLNAVSSPAYAGWGLVADSNKNIYMTDSTKHIIYKIQPSGTYSVFAGTYGASGATDGTQTGAGSNSTSGSGSKFNGITGVTIDSSGNLYASDTGNNTIRKITPAGVVTTIAGTAGTSGSTDATGSSARFNSPWDIDIDASGNLYIADRSNNLIRKLTLSGATYTASTIAGTAGSPGSTDGTGSAARFNAPTGISVDSSGNIFVSDTNNDTIRKITSGGVVTTVAGLAGVTSAPGSTDAIGTAAKFNSPWDIDIDSSGNLYVADKGNNLIRKLTLSGSTYTASTIAGTAGSAGSADGIGSAARFNAPTGLAFNPASGMIFVSDTNNDTIRQINPATNQVITVAGATIVSVGSSDGTGSAALFNAPTGLAVDAFGYVFVTDTGNNTLRRLAPPSMSIEIEGADSATVSGPIANDVHKTGAGTSVLSGDNSSLLNLSVDAGLVKVSATNHMGKSVSFNGGNMEVTSGTVAIPVVDTRSAATITTDSGAAVSSIAAPYGTSLLTIAGSGVVTAGNMSASATPLSIPGVMYVGASSSSKMPTGVATVPSGGLVKIMGNTASSVPGATQLQSGAVLEVADSIAVPAHTGADIFGTLKFDSGSMLKLGASSNWARDISVGTAL